LKDDFDVAMVDYDPCAIATAAPGLGPLEDRRKILVDVHYGNQRFEQLIEIFSPTWRHDRVGQEQE